MGIGDGGRGNPRGRPQGRPVYPSGNTGESDYTDLQQLAQAVESSSSDRARSQPPTRRPEATHPMTTRQQTAPPTSLLDSVVATVSSVLTGTPPASHSRPPTDQPPPPSTGQPTRPTIQLMAQGSPDSQDQQAEPDPDATTLPSRKMISYTNHYATMLNQGSTKCCLK